MDLEIEKNWAKKQNEKQSEKSAGSTVKFMLESVKPYVQHVLYLPIEVSILRYFGEIPGDYACEASSAHFMMQRYDTSERVPDKCKDKIRFVNNVGDFFDVDPQRVMAKFR